MAFLIFSITGIYADHGASLFLFGLVGGGSLPLCFSITRDLFPFQLMGAATGFMNCASFLSSTIYMPFTGFLLKTVSQAPAVSYSFAAYRMLFIVFILSYAGAFIAILLLKNRKDLVKS